jgi:hypothetical protein
MLEIVSRERIRKKVKLTKLRRKLHTQLDDQVVRLEGYLVVDNMEQLQL